MWRYMWCAHSGSWWIVCKCPVVFPWSQIKNKHGCSISSQSFIVIFILMGFFFRILISTNCLCVLVLCILPSMCWWKYAYKVLGCLHFDICFCVLMNVCVCVCCLSLLMCMCSHVSCLRQTHKIPSKGSSELWGECQDLNHLLSVVPCDEAGEAVVSWWRDSDLAVDLHKILPGEWGRISLRD